MNPKERPNMVSARVMWNRHHNQVLCAVVADGINKAVAYSKSYCKDDVSTQSTNHVGK